MSDAAFFQVVADQVDSIITVQREAGNEPLTFVLLPREEYKRWYAGLRAAVLWGELSAEPPPSVRLLGATYQPLDV